LLPFGVEPPVKGNDSNHNMAAAEAKDSFEKEREQILASLPDNVKDMFGIMGFCKVDQDDDEDEDEENSKPPPVDEYVPCLVLNPYEVPPRPVRDVYWWDCYSIRKRKKQLKKLEYLVYHYGTDDPDDCYSFIQQDDFVSYDDGIAQGYGKLPAAIQSKLDAGDELTYEEEKRVRGLKEMEEDAPKEKGERKRGNWQFKERHELLEAKEPANKRQKK
jgi:hypothetical protein